MDGLDPRLRAATLEQLARRREALAAGAKRIGWKLGTGKRESIGGSLAVGYLTSATLIEPGGTYPLGGIGAELHADVELAVELDRYVDPDGDAAAAGAAVGAYLPALEIVDLAPVLGEAEAVVATNIFHRAVTFGGRSAKSPHRRLRATADVSGERRDEADADVDVGELLLAAARILAAVGEQLAPGDRVITGSIVQIPIAPGDDVVAELASLGSVRLTIAA